VFQQPGADPASGPADIGRELAEQQAGHRIGWLAGPDGSRQDVRNDGGRGKAVIADDAPRLVDDKDGGEALLLTGKRPGLELALEVRIDNTFGIM
jgi:hypothetical protein